MSRIVSIFLTIVTFNSFSNILLIILRKKGSIMLKFVWIILSLTTSLLAIDINNQITFNELLSHAEIYEDKNRTQTIETIQTKKFKSNKNTSLGYGYSPNIDVWIRFTLENKTNDTVYKVMEYGNPLTTSVTFFEEGVLKKKGGLINKPHNRVTLNPTFNIVLNPHESKQYYIKVSSFITTLIIELNLWDKRVFDKQEKYTQTILTLFFGAMFIMIIYHFTIFINTGQRSYFYYSLFITSMSCHHFIYTGAINIYVPLEYTKHLIHYFSIIVAITTIFLTLFTKNILNLQQYPRLNQILIGLLIFYPIIIFIIDFTKMYHFRSLFFLIILLFLFYLTIYIQLKRNKKVNFVLLSLILFTLSGVLMYLSSMGSLHIFQKFPYLIELSLLVQAITFSLALASQINLLSQEQLISRKRALFLKELKHRIQNNLQTILSFITLQKDKIDNKMANEVLTSLENRIISTTHLYTLLNTEDVKKVINTNTYFYAVVDNIKNSFQRNNIEININSEVIMSPQYVEYCCLIINEAVTNSFKYAFKDIHNPKIDISLYKTDSQYTLSINDNGNGFEQKKSQTLGLEIIETLAVLQLGGTLNINSNSGVRIKIKWSQDEK